MALSAKHTLILTLPFQLFFGTGCGFECDVTTRDGTYVAHFEQRDGGTCGTMTDVVVYLDSSERFEAGDTYTTGGQTCTVDEAERPADECTVDRTITCINPAEGLQYELVAATTQDAADGSALSGVATMTFYTYPGAEFVCTSTYDLTYERE